MAEQALEERINDLKDDIIRYDFAADIVVRIRESENITPLVIPAIDELVRLYCRAGKIRRKNSVIVVEGNYSARINPVHTLGRRVPSTEYKITLFNRRYLLKVFSGFKDFPIDVKIRLKKGNLEFDWDLDGNKHTKSYSKNDFFYYQFLSGDRLINSSGAAIKRTRTNGRLRIGSDYCILGESSGDQDILVVFSRGHVYHFDFFGRRILPAIGSLERIETRKMIKTSDTCDRMKNLDLDDWTEKLFKQVVQRWLDRPLDFQMSAVNIITYGEFAVKTSKAGIIPWYNHRRDGSGRRNYAINVGYDCPYKSVVLKVKGNYVSVHDKEEVLNAHCLPAPLTFGSLGRRYHIADDIGIISVKTLEMNITHPRDKHGLFVGRQEYQFGTAHLKYVLGCPIDSFDRAGIVGFRNGRNTSFIILAKRGADLFSFDVEHTGVKDTDYQGINRKILK